MNYKALQRNYRQMIRIIRDKANSATSYKMGNAFGSSGMFGNSGVSPTDLQLRTLEEMNLPSTSLRRPGPTAEGGDLSTRVSSANYHELNDSTQHYLNGQGGAHAHGRSDGTPGTKLRTELSKDAPNKFIHEHAALQPQSQQSQQPKSPEGKDTDKAKKVEQSKPQSNFTAFDK
jgi:hypothetical protein